MADSILKEQNITDAQAALTNYWNTCDGLYNHLQSTIEQLTAQGASFNGDSADGYNEFFKKITPTITTNIQSLTEDLSKMLKGIKEALLESADQGLGDSNRNAGGSGSEG